jgi:hypothetical protein
MDLSGENFVARGSQLERGDCKDGVKQKSIVGSNKDDPLLDSQFAWLANEHEITVELAALYGYEVHIVHIQNYDDHRYFISHLLLFRRLWVGWICSWPNSTRSSIRVSWP